MWIKTGGKLVHAVNGTVTAETNKAGESLYNLQFVPFSGKAAVLLAAVDVDTIKAKMNHIEQAIASGVTLVEL